ncbi:RNA polymerase sigma factor [Robinsoniella peoriensis]
MAYNKAKEEKEWKHWKENEENKLRELGMDEELIQQLRQRDWEEFKEERRYREHQTPYPDYRNLHAEGMKEPEIYGVQSLLQSIDNEHLLHILLQADQTTLHVLLLKMMGYSFREIAEKLKMPEQTIYTKVNRLRKKLKKFWKSE